MDPVKLSRSGDTIATHQRVRESGCRCIIPEAVIVSAEYISNTGVVSSAEFDAFGPWIEVLRSPESVPRLYAGYPIDFEATRLVLKVPRNLSRRDAHPSMHLYDHILIVGDTELTVLSRTGGDRGDANFTESRIGFAAIAAITDSVNLLDGILTVQTVDGQTHTVIYNGSSEKVIAGFIDQVREQIRRSRPAPLPTVRGASRPMTAIATLDLDDLGKKDVSLVTSFRDLVRADAGLRLLAAHGRSIVASSGDALSQAAHLAYPATLHGIVVCANNDELQLLSRRDWIVRRGAPVVSRVRTVIPFHTLSGVTVAPHPQYQNVDVVTLGAGSATVVVVVPRDSLAERALVDFAPR